MSDLDAIFPGGVEIENPDTFVTDMKAAGERLPEDVYKVNVDALNSAIAANDRAKTILAVGKMAFDLGMRLKS